MDLSEKKIRDKDLKHVVGLTSLSVLILNGTRPTDDWLKQLNGMACPERLQIEIAKVTDAGSVHWNSLTSLQKLNLRNIPRH